MAKIKQQQRNLTPPVVAERLGVATLKVIGWIKSGELRAIDVANRGCSRPRYSISHEALAEFERAREVVPAAKPARRRKTQPTVKDYFTHLR